MLDLVYLALVAAPLTLAATALLLIAVRSFRGHADERAERRRLELERAHDRPAGMRKRDAPLAETPSIASMPDVRALGRTVVASLSPDPPAPRAEAPSVEALTALVESLAYPPREALRRADLERPHVGAAPARTKTCPDCAEEILAAARVCKHCRCRFDDVEPGRLSA
jgi:hypothetical protein